MNKMIYLIENISRCGEFPQLVKYDHHVVHVNGRRGVMLTGEWMPVEEHAGPFVLTVVSHHAEKHPRAPEEVQAIVEGLRFQVRGQPR